MRQYTCSARELEPETDSNEHSVQVNVEHGVVRRALLSVHTQVLLIEGDWLPIERNRLVRRKCGETYVYYGMQPVLPRPKDSSGLAGMRDSDMRGEKNSIRGWTLHKIGCGAKQ